VNNTCLCDEGWSQSLELAFFNEDESGTSGTCGNNEQFIFWLHVLNLVLCCTALLQQLLFVGSLGSLKRAVPGLVLMLLLITASSRRISNQNAFLADDLIYSFFFANAFACMHVLLVIFFDRYLEYLSKRLNFGDVRDIRNRVIFVRKLNIVLIFGDTIASQLLWIAALTNQGTALFLIRFALTIFMLRNIYNTSLYVFVFTSTIRDLKLLMQAKNFGGIQAGKENNFVDWLNRRIPQMIKMRKDAIVSSSITLFFIYIPAVFTDFGIEILKYTLIVVPITFMIGVISTVKLNAIKMKSNDSSDMGNDRVSTGTVTSVNTSARNMSARRSAAESSKADAAISVSPVTP